MVELDAACFAPPFRFSRETMRRFIEAENAWGILADDGGDLAGFCIVHREKVDEGEIGYVVTIDVAEKWRGYGIGEQMLSAGEAWVHSWKGAGMILHVFVKNKRAMRFYERMQYGQVGTEAGFYGSGLDAALYWKEIAHTQR